MSDPVLRARPAAPLPLRDLTGRWQSPVDEADFALPTITDTAGSVGVVWGPTGVQNWLEPPTGLPSPIGLLHRIDDAGRPVRVGPEGTAYRWSPWRIERRHPAVSATTVLHPDGPALTETLTFAEPGRYALVFGGLCRAWSFAHYWNLPATDVPQLNVRLGEGDGRILIGDTKTFGLAAIRVEAPAGAALAAYGEHDDFVTGRAPVDRGRVAVATFEVAAGDRVSWTAVQGSEPDPVMPSPSAAARAEIEAEAHWDRLWEAAFDAENDEFGGHLPAIGFDDPALDRLYAHGVLALLMGRRRHRPQTARDRFATGGQAIWADDPDPFPVGWTIGTTEGAPTTMFVWELHLTAPLLSRLDPIVFRDQLTAFLRSDVSRHWGLDLLSGRPVGMWYAINDTAIVAAAADYLAATGDRAWLSAPLGDGLTVADRLLHHVERHEERSGGDGLADYGPAENLLECVPDYAGEVAAMNAMAAWAYRFAAAELAPHRSEELITRAEAIEAAVLERIQPDGVFRCGRGDDLAPVRTVVDLIYVGEYLGARVPVPVREAMLRFAREELITDDWLRALSPDDAGSLSDALPDFQTFRADHQSTGSYDGWPAMTAAIRARWGEADEAVAWLRRISRLTEEGPFGQAHRVGVPPTTTPASKASFMNGNCYTEVCGSRFALTLLELAGLVATAPGAAR